MEAGAVQYWSMAELVMNINLLFKTEEANQCCDLPWRPDLWSLDLFPNNFLKPHCSIRLNFSLKTWWRGPLSRIGTSRLLVKVSDPMWHCSSTSDSSSCKGSKLLTTSTPQDQILPLTTCCFLQLLSRRIWSCAVRKEVKESHLQRGTCTHRIKASTQWWSFMLPWKAQITLGQQMLFWLLLPPKLRWMFAAERIFFFSCATAWQLIPYAGKRPGHSPGLLGSILHYWFRVEFS